MERIVSTLSTNNSITIEDMIELQNDSYSSLSFNPHILEIIINQQEYDFSLPVSYLENWDYKYTQNLQKPRFSTLFSSILPKIRCLMNLVKQHSNTLVNMN